MYLEKRGKLLFAMLIIYWVIFGALAVLVSYAVWKAIKKAKNEVPDLVIIDLLLR